MSYYMYQASYTDSAWAAKVSNPQNRLDTVRPAVENLGGKLETAFYCFGEYDIIFICTFPDNISARAISMAAFSGGMLTGVKVTPLLTIEEAIIGMKMASKGSISHPS
ncbi:MAG: GYD domain-containing protein [Chloroflexi bacterium]|nr:GYD domain-containing protein [Chloroflexota bacterium]MQG06025.1 GYD domain-containing protein [SAR202 cluster bacterium]